MNVEIIGTGRAAGAIALAAHRAGHRVTGIAGRNASARRELLRVVPVEEGPADLRIVAVSDDAIAQVAAGLTTADPVPTVHVSGAKPVAALGPLSGDMAIGAFHPLQTLPDAVAGADRLAGAWIAVTADEPLASKLDDFARSLGCVPFRIADADKAIYHAAAAACANFPLASLGLAARLFADAGVPFEAARPLVDAIVANAFALGPDAALTGPIARDDRGTVRTQIEAITRRSPGDAETFRHFARGTAEFVGASPDMWDAIG